MKDYLKFKKETYPHCGKDIEVTIRTEVIDRFQFVYEAVLKKVE